MPSSIIRYSAIISSILVIPFLVSAQSWTPAPASPPSNNASAPINVSAANQAKSGGLQVGSFVSDGGALISGTLGVGAVDASYKLNVVGDVKGTRLCIGTDCRNAWPAAGGSGTVTQINTGSGLTGGPITTSGTISLNLTSISTCTASTQKILWDSTNNRFTCGTDQTGGGGGSVTINTGGGITGGTTGSIFNLNIDSNVLQRRITGTCYGQVIVGINSDGTVACEADDTGGGGGISGSGTTNYVSKFTGGTSIGNSQIYDNGSNVGIGTASPSQKLTVQGNAAVSGEVYANAFFYSSDRNLKTNIAPLQTSLAKISALQGVSFNWKNGGRASIGFIAQDVERVVPELVHTSVDGTKSVEYGNMTALLVEAIKEQQAQIDALKAEIEALKSN